MLLHALSWSKNAAYIRAQATNLIYFCHTEAKNESLVRQIIEERIKGKPQELGTLMR